MDRTNVDAVIVGAGPYGLSVASHLSHRGVSRRIFGYPMRAWRLMPPGMYLKSFGFATNIPTPQKGYTLPEYCRARGLEDFEPILTSTFGDYGDWFQQQLVPDVEQKHVTDVTPVDGGFDITLEDGERFRTRRVVIASGLGYYPNIPQVFASLPNERVYHGSRTREFLKTVPYAGRDVVVVGAGQTALEAAALLHEGGARVRVIARHNIWWSDRFAERSLRNKLLNPNTVIGPGRKNWVIEHLPMLPYYLPDEKRVPFTRRYLGPLGAWWLRDRVDGKVPTMTFTPVVGSSFADGRITLQLQPANGGPRQVQADYVISGTGYEADVDRLPFFTPDVAAKVRRVERAPRLSPYFESSIPGMYFVGPQASFSFGPLVRFVAGAYFSTPKVSAHLAGSVR